MIDVEYQLDISESEISSFLNSPVNEEKINKAIARAFRKTITWLKAQTARGLSKELDVLVNSLKERIYFDYDENQAGVNIWVGLNDLHANSIGKLRQTRQGVSARSHRFRGAFIADAHNGRSHVNAWRRASSNHSNPLDEVRNKKTERNQQNPQAHSKWPRYPLLKVGLRIEEPGYDHLKKQERYISERFNTLLKQELNYEFHVKS